VVFSSFTFLFVFLPVLTALYFLVPSGMRSIRNLILLIFSLLFYAYGGLRLLPIMLFSIVLNYVFGLLVSGRRSKAAVFGALAGNLGLLIWFKYAGFITENLNAVGLLVPTLDIVLPIGISFYTFQGLSYVLDVYRKDARPERNILKVALYISLFPQLVAGPIVRYATIAEEISQRRETVGDFSQGGIRFLFGLSKKVLIANQLAQIADAAFKASPGELTAGLAWLGILSYTAQIYFDFSGYSDMAIGLGRIFGFNFLENFNYPYIANSITDFWRRWHISLSTWFRDYLYIPLGGNRVGLFKQIRNLLIVWLLTGLWHGAAWNFIFWGLYYALLLIGERYLWGKALSRLPALFRHIYALLFIILGWVLFRSTSLSQAFLFVKTMFGASGAPLWSGQTAYYLLQYRWELIAAVFASLPLKVFLKKRLEARSGRAWSDCLLVWGVPVLALLLGLMSVISLLGSGFNPFIYYQF